MINSGIKTILVVAVASALTGCAFRSGAIQVGADTYQTSATAAPARGGPTAARKLALEQANRKCQELGRQIEVTNVSDAAYAFPANSEITVTFRCDPM